MNILVFSEGKMYKINNKNMKEGTEDITIIASSPYKYNMTYREIDIMTEEIRKGTRECEQLEYIPGVNVEIV